MTGVINSDDSTLLLILINKTKKITRIVMKVHDDKEIDVENYVTVHVNESKSKMKVKTNETGIPEVNFDIKLKISVSEYPSENLGNPKERKMLKKKTLKNTYKRHEPYD
jgi:spore germination protein KC